MFVPTRGFLGMADSMEPCKMWADPCCHGNEISARRLDRVAYRLVVVVAVVHDADLVVHSCSSNRTVLLVCRQINCSVHLAVALGFHCKLAFCQLTYKLCR